MYSSMKELVDKFFDLYREHHEEIAPQEITEILSHYADRLDG